MAALPLVLAAFSAISAIKQGEDNAYNQELQRNSANFNAEASKQSADTALQESAAAQSAKRRQVRQFLANQRAGITQSGTGTGGSNAALLEQSQTLSELDVLNVAYEGQMKSRGFNIQSQQDEFTAGIYGSNARNARTAGYLNAGKSILTNAYQQYGPKTTKSF